MNKNFSIRKFSTSLRRLKYQEVTEFNNGRKLTLETGDLAKMADGAAVATIGGTSVLVTSVSKIRAGPTASFMPLTVDYRQKYAAAGRIPSNFLRRELAPTEKEILTSRVVDRSIRPLFPSDYYHDTQITCQLMAVDGRQEPDIIGINAASASLAISNIPWNGPVGAVRVGIVNGEVITFPSRKELAESDLNLIITAAEDNNIVMLEGGAMPVLIQDMKKAIKVGVKECQKIIRSIQNLARQIGKEKREYSIPPSVPEDIILAVRSLCSLKIEEIFSDTSHDKLSRDNAVNLTRLGLMEKLKETFADVDSSIFNEAFNYVSKDIFRKRILEKNIRCDGRDLSSFRPMSCSIDLFKSLHGSSVFQRGQTQVQCTVAYDSPDKAVKVDPLLQVTGGNNDRNFLLHYSFPAYANNELPRGGGVSRREIGHGALAAKGLRPILPKDNPFCILLTSTVMESNGSSSMATVCGGSLAFMDAGVDISTHAAGVAIGLVTKVDEKGQIEDYRILTDILGIEDYMGDMDFKIAGTKNGITAIQADIKLPGVPIKIIMDGIEEGFKGIKFIIKIMNETIAAPRSDKENLPLIVKREVPVHKRGALLAAGAVKLKSIEAKTGVEISWEDNTTLSVFATNKESMDEAMQIIDESLQSEPELDFGSIYTARIVEIRPQGVMITLYEGMRPILLHNSHLDVKKVSHPHALNLKEGDDIKVKYFGRDSASGQMRVSRAALLSVAPRHKIINQR